MGSGRILIHSIRNGLSIRTVYRVCECRSVYISKMWSKIPLIRIAIVLILASQTVYSAETGTSNKKKDRNPYTPNEGFSNPFDWQLLKEFSGAQFGNVILSPISIKLVMAMLYEGSSGATEREIKTTMGFTSKLAIKEYFNATLSALKKESKDYVLNIGMRVFLESMISPEQKFSATVKSIYKADIEPTNFENKSEATKQINSWIDTLTNGRITKLVKEDDLKDALMLITSAIYFKGDWKNPFRRNETHTGGFYLTPTQSVQVEYMTNIDRYFFMESSELDVKILKLPYKGDNFAMYVILPKSKGGLPKLLSQANLSLIKRQLSLLQNTTVEVVFPKIKFDFGTKLSTTLQKLGLVQMFQNTASFPGIARGNNLQRQLVVSDISQKAGIELNEEGSTAYAATDIVIGNKFGETDETFNATHPFMFYIVDEKSQSILFIGKVENPLQRETLPQVAPVPDLPSRVDVSDNERPSVAAAPEANTEGLFELNPQTDDDNYAAFKRFNNFDIELLQTFVNEEENFVISPLSVKAVLGMILEGARGSSADELRESLRLSNDQKVNRELFRTIYAEMDSPGTATIKLANKLFVASHLELVPEYRKALKDFYKGDVDSVNYARPQEATDKINTWVNEMTNGLIPEIVKPEYFKPESTVVIANALYFKDAWQQAFEPHNTKKDCFYLKSGKCQKTNMMEITEAFKYGVISDLEATAIEIPYQDGKYSMIVMLPNKKDGIQLLIRDFSHFSLDRVISKLEATEVFLTLPRFTIDYSSDLVQKLFLVKITEIFGPNSNLSGIVNGEAHSSVNTFIHKAKIQVNERGTTAAAATGGVVIPLMGPSIRRFLADHPFLFFIRNTASGNILFQGVLLEPTKDQQQRNYGGRDREERNYRNTSSSG